MRVGLSADRHLLDHFEAVSLQADDFLWVICQKPKLPHAQIEKDLRAEPVIAQVTRIALCRGLPGACKPERRCPPPEFAGAPHAIDFHNHSGAKRKRRR